MKAHTGPHRNRAFRLWRAGQPGLIKLQELVDRLITAGSGPEADNEPDLRSMALSLADVKIRLNKELRDNAAFDIRHRRETIELDDIELSKRAGVSMLLKVKAEIESQVQRLIELHDLGAAVGLRPIPAVATVATVATVSSDHLPEQTVPEPVQSEPTQSPRQLAADPDGSDNDNGDLAETDVGPHEPTGSSEGAPESTATDTTTDEGQTLSDEPRDTETIH